MVQKRTNILRLKDKRLMEYAEYGDPLGKPVLFFHGYLGSLSQAILADESARTHGIRIIAPNRPGIGRSSPAKFDIMTEYADDIRQLAEVLKIDSFAIIGASGGACYALACAYAMPTRVTIAGVAGGIGPLNVMNNLQQMKLIRRVFLSSCHDHPWITRVGLRFMFNICKRHPRWSHWLLTRTSSVLDSNLLRRNEVRQILWWDYEDVFLQKNGIDGLLEEARLFFHWGFNLRDFPETVRVFFWHGKDDSIIPWSVIKETAKHIPRQEAVLCPGGHLAFLTKVEDIILRIKNGLSEEVEWGRGRGYTRASFFRPESYAPELFGRSMSPS